LELSDDVSCCFSGHRPQKLPWGEQEWDARCVTLKDRIRTEVERAYDDGFRHFICGMAQGCDFYFCEAVLTLQGERPDITLEAAIPHEKQAARWPENAQACYSRLVEQCDKTTVVSPDGGHTRGCMLRRNRYMVDHARRLIAVFGGKTGGTMNTIAYARRLQREIVLVDIPGGRENLSPFSPRIGQSWTPFLRFYYKPQKSLDLSRNPMYDTTRVQDRRSERLFPDS